MKKFITNHPGPSTALTCLIAVIITLIYLLAYQGYAIRDLLHQELLTILSISTTICAILIAAAIYMINDEEKKSSGNQQIIYNYKVFMVFTPLFLTILFIFLFPFLTKPSASNRIMAVEKAQVLSTRVENYVAQHLPADIVYATAHNRLNADNILAQLEEGQHALADSLLNCLGDSLEKSDRNYVSRVLDSTLTSLKSYNKKEVEELLKFTADIQSALASNDLQKVDVILRDHHVKEDAVLFEYQEDLNGPARDMHSFRKFLIALIKGDESKRFISAVIKLDRENEFISNVYILTNNQ